jgi:hypothetical protein
MDARDTTAVIDRALAGEMPVTGYPLERELQELTLALASSTSASSCASRATAGLRG